MSSLSIGVLAGLGPDPAALYEDIRQFGLCTCQLVNWQPEQVSPELAAAHRAAAAAAGVTITAFWCGYSGPAAWNYVEGPATIGLVPPEYRAMRTRELRRGAEIAHWLGTADMATHVGFLPPNPRDPDYLGTVEALKAITDTAGELGVTFNFETGQETPMVLLRCFQDVGRPNMGVNLDPANLLMYGNGNPVDALEIFGRFVRGVHAKDGDYPTDGYELGPEKPLGEGRVNFPKLVAGLKAHGYTGALTIEREISGPQQAIDIRRAIELLTPLL